MTGNPLHVPRKCSGRSPAPRPVARRKRESAPSVPNVPDLHNTCATHIVTTRPLTRSLQNVLICLISPYWPALERSKRHSAHLAHSAQSPRYPSRGDEK